MTPQPGYEVATTQNGTYGSAAITVANNATVWVRFAATVAVGTYNSTTVAVLSGGGASSTANVTTTSSGNNVAPANDLSSNPTSITVNGAAANGTTVAATVVAPFTDSKNDVWYSFTPTTSGTVTLTTTSSSSQDLDIQAWASAAPSSSTANQLISNGADPGNTTEIATLTVTADTIYFVRVLQFGGTAGTFTITAALPTITGAATASAFTTTYGTASAAQNFAVSGSNLTANIVATAPTGFQVSSDGTTYDGTATFTQSGGSASGTLRVRLAVTAPVIGNYNSQNIVLSTTGGGNVNITTAASGNSVSQKALTITGATAANKVYNGTTAIAVSGGSLTTGSGAGQVLSADSANVTLSAASAAGTVADANVGTSKAVTVTGYSISGASAGNYSITQPTGLTANITAKDLTITGLSAANKNWDGTTAVSVTGAPEYVGLVAGEPFSVTGTVTWVFPDANVGTNKTLTRTGSYDAPSSNYTVTQPNLTASINAVVPGEPSITEITPGNGQLSVAFTPGSNGGASITNYEYSINGGGSWTTPSPAVTSSPLLITGLTNGIPYDVQIRAVNSAGIGTATGTTQGTPLAPTQPTLEVFPASFANPMTTTYGVFSSSQNFTVTGTTLDGTNAVTVTPAAGLEISTSSNFSTTIGTLSSPLNLGTSSDINTTVYVRLAATAAAGSYDGQSIVVAGGGAATSPTVQTASTGNTVAQAGLTITNISISSKEYDGTTSATISGPVSYVGLQNGQDFTVTGTPTATFDNKNVGTGKSVTVTGYTAPSANYTVTQPTLTGTITAKPLSITPPSIAPKTYNATTTAGAVTVGTLSGFVDTETVTATGSAAAYSSADVGTYSTTVSYTLADGTNGGLAINYSLANDTASGEITKANQTITFTNNLTGLLPGSTNALSATADSGLTVTYEVGNTNIATLSGTNLIAVAAGATTVVASQTGNANYNAATPVTNNVSVATALQAGDIAVIAFQTDDPDAFAFVALTDISADTRISFTENAWNGTSLAANESTIVWTAPAGGVLAGTIVTFANGTGFSVGTSTGSFNGASTSGDQILVYTGSSASPTFVYALSSLAWIATGTPTANNSYLPAGLTNGTSARDFSTETDNQYYNIPAISGTKATILASIGNTANWSRSDTRYSSITNPTITVTRTQSITFGAISAKTYGDAPFTLSATSDSALPVTLTSLDTNVATVAGSNVTILKAGSASIVASQAGGTTNGMTYVAATPVTNLLTVSPRAIEVTANATNKVYGASNPPLTFTVSSNSLVAGDSLAGTLTTAATTNSPVSGSPYAITQGTLTSSNNPNYTISFVTNGLTVNVKALTVTANNVSKAQGATLTGGPGSTAFTSSGLVSGDAIDSVTITYTSGGDSEAPAGSYAGAVVPSAATGSSFLTGNYNIDYMAGNLTVSSSPQISAIGTLGAQSTIYGAASAATSFTVSGGNLTGNLAVTAPAGFELSTDDISYTTNGLALTQSGGTVTNTPIYVRLAATTGFGTYSGNVEVSGGGAEPLSVAIPGSTVTKKGLTITGLSGVNREYDGTTSATFTGSAAYNGLVNGESFPVAGTPSASFADKVANTNRLVAITGYLPPSANYSLTDPTVRADITTKALTVSGAAVTAKDYDGNTGAVITGTLAGVVAGDEVTLSGTGTFASATPGSGIAVTSTSTLGGLDAANYSLNQPTGLTGTINKTANSITFGSLANKITGDAPFALTATATSGLPVSFSSSDSSVASVAGNTVTILKSGKVTITATQDGDANFGAATPVQQSFIITGAGSILFTGINTSNPDQFSFVAMHDLPGNLAITFTDNAWSGTALATNEGNLVYTTPVVGLAAGSRIVIERSASGNTATVLSGNGAVGAPGANFLLGGGDNLFAYTGSSTSPNFLAGILTSASTIPNSISATTVQVVSTGSTSNSHYIGATTGVASLLAAALVDRANWTNSSSPLTLNTGGITFIASQLSQQITFGALEQKVYGDASFSLSGTADSGLALSYTSSDTTVATVSGSTVTILKAGSTTLTASQIGNPQYAAATPVPQILVVAPKSLTGSFTVSNKTYDGTTAATVATRAASGKVGSDDVNHTGGTASFDNANVGTGKIVTLAGATLTGAAAANYTLSSVSTATSSITAKILMITGASATSRAYDGTTNVVVSGGSLNGVVGSDDVTLGGAPAGSVTSAVVGTNKAVTVTGFSISGAAAGNYSLTQPTGVTVDITAASLASNQITLTPGAGNAYTASGPAGSTFTISYAGRTANGIATSYSSSTAPTAAGYYTVTATATGNYTGANTVDYFVAGLVAGNDSVTKPTDNSRIKIPVATLLANDGRILSNGTVETANLSVSNANQGTGSAPSAVSGAFVFFYPSAYPDNFTYTLTDSSTGQTATATVTVTTEAAPPSFDLQIIGQGTASYNGTQTSITMDFIGVPNQTYIVEYKGETTDSAWTSAGAQSTGSTGSFSVTFTKAGDHTADWNGSMFFRASVNP